LYANKKNIPSLGSEGIYLYDCFNKPILKYSVCIFNLKLRTLPALERNLVWSATYTYIDHRTFSVEAFPVIFDGHNHSLAIIFPFPASVHGLPAFISIQATANNNLLPTPRFPLQVPLTNAPELRHYLVACTFISDSFWNAPNIDVHARYLRQAEVVCLWVWYHLANGFEYIIIYLDLKNREFVNLLSHALVAELKNGQVSFSHAFVNNRESFLSQQAIGTHCLYWFKGQATWLGSMDVDEFFVADKAYPKISDALKWLENERNGTFTFKMYGTILCNPKTPAKWTTDLLSLTAHYPRKWPKVSKCIFNTEYVYYFSVHVPTTPNKVTRPRYDFIWLAHLKHYGAIRPCTYSTKTNTTFEERWKITFSRNSKKTFLLDLKKNHRQILQKRKITNVQNYSDNMLLTSPTIGFL